MRCLDGITNSMDMNLGKLCEMVRDREALASCITWGHKVRRKLVAAQTNIYARVCSKCLENNELFNSYNNTVR